MSQIYKLSIEELCSKLKPVFGKKIDDIYLKYAMAETMEEKNQIEQIIRALYHKNLDKLLGNKVLLEPPTSEILDGEYPLGFVNYAGKNLFNFSLREKDWSRHVCISGMSGGGKTTFAFHILENFVKKKKPFLVFDWKKSFRPLTLLNSNIFVFTPGNEAISNFFKMNINKPPKDVAPKEWINVLCDLITESFFASYGVHKVLLETLDEAFKEHGIYHGSQDYPTWNYIKWKIETKLANSNGREASWLESALRIAHVLTFGSFGKVLNYKGKESLNIEELFDKQVIFELNSLGNLEKKFFAEFLLTYIYKLKKAEQSKINEKFEYAIIVDEAHNVFLKDKTNFVKESVTDMVYREMREYGVGLICLDQHISKLSDTVRGNSACHIAFQQQLPQDIWDISQLMQLTEKKQYFSNLEVGSAIVKLSERFTTPFLIKVEKAQLRANAVSDNHIKQRMNFIFDGRKIENSDSDFAKTIVGEKTKNVEEPIDKNDVPEKDNSTKNIVGEIKDSNYIIEENGILEDINEKIISYDVKKPDSNFKERLEEKYSDIKNEEKWPEEKQEVRVAEHPLYNKQFQKIEDSKNFLYKNHVVNPIKEKKDIYSDHKENSQLTSIQNILFEFVDKKIKQGFSIREIENLLEENKEKYNFKDIAKAVDYALLKKFENINSISEYTDVNYNDSEKETTFVTTNKIQKVYKSGVSKSNAPKSLFLGGLTNDQKRFLAFLRENKNHELSSVDLYKTIGFSARKGTKIKDSLLKLGLVKVQEIRNERGWKKIIQIKEN